MSGRGHWGPPPSSELWRKPWFWPSRVAWQTCAFRWRPARNCVRARPMAAGPSSRGSFQVGPAMKVRLAYRVFDAEGVPVEENPSEFEYIHGFSVMLPQLEDAVAGLAVGGRREVNLAAESAFGPRRKEAIVEF